MISDLEDNGYLTDTADEDHIPDNGGIRLPSVAHRWSTAYHILHDFVTIEDLRKTPIDLDGNVWYKEEWDVLYCAVQNSFADPIALSGLAIYFDYLIKSNASNNSRNTQIGSRVRGYFYYPFARVSDVTYAVEGYDTGNPKRAPNSALPGISTHIYGLAVDVSEGTMHNTVWLGQNTEIDTIAYKHDLWRPLNTYDYVDYTDDEKAEWWHFESIK